MFKEDLTKIFSDFNIEISSEQALLFEKYYEKLIKTNKLFNLTSITEEKDVIIKHFLDSVLPLSIITPNSHIIDIGTGAGFPILPIKIMRPDIKGVAIDSVNKKINFVNDVILDLNLKNITPVHARAEDLARKVEYREQFDLCLSRAVAELRTLVEYALPLLKLHGKFIAYKGGNVEEEIKNAQNAIKLLGGKIKEIKTLKIYDMTRSFVIIEKISHTNALYPRLKNKPRTSPL